MKHITITGPHAAGKDSVINELAKIFEAKYPGRIKKVLFVTTRKPRADETDGVDHIFISEKEFDAMLKNQELLYNIQLSGYRVGTPWSQIKQGEVFIHNITLEGAKVLEKTWPTLKVALNSPAEHRLKRVMLREPKISAEQAKTKLLLDPRGGIETYYDKFDLVIENPDGAFANTVETIRQAVENFS